MARIDLRGLGHTYSNGVEAVKNVDLAVDDGEFLVLVGPSGCGKSTILRMVAGLEAATVGEILIDSTLVNDVPPQDRDLAMVFQNYALYPHLSVYDNMSYGLKVRRLDSETIDERVRRAAATLGLDEVLDRKPKTLSGGQRQRVAMGRAIVRQPRAFLMDEPLSNLDAKLRVDMRAEIARLQRDLRITTLYVTHDQVEALTLGERVAVLKDGVLQQVDSPEVLYQRPANVFVAEFIGSPPMNLVNGTLELDEDRLTARVGGRSLHVGSAAIARHPRATSMVGREVIIGMRPEHLHLSPAGRDAAPSLLATVDLDENIGSERLLYFTLRDEQGAPVAASERVSDLDEGLERLSDSFVAKLHGHEAVSYGASRSANGTVQIHAEADQLHFFDPETTEAL